MASTCWPSHVRPSCDARRLTCVGSARSTALRIELRLRTGVAMDLSAYQRTAPKARPSLAAPPSAKPMRESDTGRKKAHLAVGQVMLSYILPTHLSLTIILYLSFLIS